MTAPGNGRPLVLRASEVQSKSVRWAWDGRLALGYLTVQTGVEGLGKSVFAAWMLARLTLGQLPGAFRGRPVNVLVAAGEDGYADTWTPRLALQGADLDRVLFMNVEDWNVQSGVHDLRRIFDEHQPQVVFIDALLDHMPPARGGESVNSPTFVRTALRPLKHLVQEKQVAAVFSMHPPKGSATHYRDLVQASQAFGAVARTGLYFAFHPDDDQDDPDARRLLLRGKGNLGPNPGSLEFRVVGRSYRHDDGHTTEREVVVGVAPSKLRLADVMPGTVVGGARKPTKAQQAASYLAAHVTSEWAPAAPLLDALRALGIGDTTSRQAALEMGIERRKAPELDGGWQWRIAPSTGDRPEPLSLRPRARDESRAFEPSPESPLVTSSEAKARRLGEFGAPARQSAKARRLEGHRAREERQAAAGPDGWSDDELQALIDAGEQALEDRG